MRGLALELGETLLGRVGLARAWERLNHALIAEDGFLGLTLFEPGFGQGQIEQAEPIAQTIAGLFHPFGVALDVGG